jgi:hypothetical protein
MDLFTFLASDASVTSGIPESAPTPSYPIIPIDADGIGDPGSICVVA